MKARPLLTLHSHDGNIFAIMGSAGRLLEEADLCGEADEMCKRVKSCHDYNEALAIISQYVQTELSDRDRGYLQIDDVYVEPELFADEQGITASIDMHFDIERRFGITRKDDDSLELYVHYKPKTGVFSATLCIYSSDPNIEQKFIDTHLFPSERAVIIKKMESVCRLECVKTLNDFYNDWQQENEQQKSKPKEKNHHDR